MSSKLERHALQLQALGHPMRLSIVRMLVQAGPAGVSAGDIQARVEMPASTLSHHLSRLVQAGVVSTRAEGTFHYYAPDIVALRALTNYLWQDCCKGGSC